MFDELRRVDIYEYGIYLSSFSNDFSKLRHVRYFHRASAALSQLCTYYLNQTFTKLKASQKDPVR